MRADTNVDLKAKSFMVFVILLGIMSRIYIIVSAPWRLVCFQLVREPPV